MDSSLRFRLSLLLIIIVTSFALLSLLAWPVPASEAGPSAVLFVDQNNVPISGEMRLLCFATTAATVPTADLMKTAIDGTLTTPLPTDCSYLAALWLRHSQPSGKHDEPAYEVYATSWAPGSSTPLAAAGNIQVRDTWPLTLFHLVVSLAWEPDPDSAVTGVADIHEGVRQMGVELYDWTEGQMLVGPLSIHTGGERWSEADLRFLPANDKRPSAFVGGIVPAALSYSGRMTRTTYTPAAIYLGRLWDGRDASAEGSGRWSTPHAYRTLAHEWAHYALFFYDEYQDINGNSGRCICDELSGAGCGFNDRDGSVMAYHYTATEFWHKDTHLTVNNFCYDTWQFKVHGQTDWETLVEWSTIQGVPMPLLPLRPPMATLNAGPSLGLARHLVGQSPGSPLFLPLAMGGGGAAPPVREIVNQVEMETVVLPAHSLPSQIYLLKGGASNPTRILPMGRLTDDPSGSILGKIRLLDAELTDTLRAFVDWPSVDGSGGVRYALTENNDPGTPMFAQANAWDVQLNHHFELVDNRVARLRLFLLEGDGRLTTPIAQLCSLDAAIGCHPTWKQPMLNAGGEWQVGFLPLDGQPELPRYAVVRIWDSHDNAVEDELVQWLQVGGGVGPSHNDGMAPLLDDVIMVNSGQPFPATDNCNLVSYMPALNADALATPLPQTVGGLIGVPLDVQITLGIDQCPPPVADMPNPLPVNVVMNMGYSQDEVDRLGLDEQTELFVLHYRPATGWAFWQQIGVDTDLNWITTQTSEDGIYAIGWLK